MSEMILKLTQKMAKREVRLKLLIDSGSQRVIFGEADKNFVDFLFTLLSLPLGAVIRLLQKQGMVGCLGNLYASVETLNETYLQSNQSKDSLLKPKVSFCGGSSAMLLPNIDSSSATKFYWCSSRCRGYIANDPKATCPNCRTLMDQVCQFVHPSGGSKQAATSVGEGGYVKGVVTYMVMDDLSVEPMSTISTITLLNNKFNIKDVGALEEKIITLDVNEGVKLLKASLQSNTVLTDVFIGKMVTTTPKSNSRGKKTTPAGRSKRKRGN